MASSGEIRFYALAARIRKALHKGPKSQSDDEPSSDTGSLFKQQRLEDIEKDNTSGTALKQQTPESLDLEYLFNETGIRVTLTTIEFGKFTFVLKYLASTKRIDKIPRKIDYQIGIAITLIALLVVIIYIFTGTLTFGLVGVVFLIAGLLAFVSAVLVYLQLKSSHSLVFTDANGNVIQRIVRRDKGIIDRLEQAVKVAVSNNHAKES